MRKGWEPSPERTFFTALAWAWLGDVICVPGIMILLDRRQPTMALLLIVVGFSAGIYGGVERAKTVAQTSWNKRLGLKPFQVTRKEALSMAERTQ